MHAKAAAITGAGSGLGQEIALGLAEKGCRVFGTGLAAGEVGELEQASAERSRAGLWEILAAGSTAAWREIPGGSSTAAACCVFNVGRMVRNRCSIPDSKDSQDLKARRP